MVFREKVTASVAPMGAFVGLLALNGLLPSLGNSFWLRSPEYWVYPLQTGVCGLVLWRFRRLYAMSPPNRWPFGIAVGVAVFALWIFPQAFLGYSPRRVGFNPDIFANEAPLYWVTVVLRFARLVVVVPLVEEIFWRGFLLRYLIDEQFDRVEFGAFSWLSFGVVTMAFGLSHSMPDWPAALATGMLYNVVAYRSRSLSTCVVTHAVTNLLLGLWIMHTKQWGFW
jgi:CAAX prenyl protease-like protein